MKLTLGTGNFNSKYTLGINQTLTDNLKKKIIKKAIESNINFFDTASVYGNAEKIIGYSNLKDQNIITKIPKINFKGKKAISSWIITKIKNSLSRLNKKKVYAILVHDLKDFLSNKKEFVKAFKILKENKLAEKIGFSLYNCKDLYNIVKFWKPDLIQIPYNIFDRRIEEKKFKNLIKKNKIELHVRSIFFKGLLVNKKLNYIV